VTYNFIKQVSTKVQQLETGKTGCGWRKRADGIVPQLKWLQVCQAAMETTATKQAPAESVSKLSQLAVQRLSNRAITVLLFAAP